MTFGQAEGSRESSRPLEAYRIDQAGTTFFFTSGEREIPAAGETWFPEPGLKRGRLTRGQAASKQTLEVDVRRTNAFAAQYVPSILPEATAEIQIYRLQLSEVPALATLTPLFDGVVVNVKRKKQKGQLATIVCQPRAGAMAQQMPRIKTQRQCNNFLYDNLCGANPDAHFHTGVVTDQSGTRVTVDGLAASNLNGIGGFARLDSGTLFRTIYGQNLDDIFVNVPYPPIVGQALRIQAGCNRLIDGDCATLFDRVIDFNGDPWLPERDPFVSAID